MECFLKYVCNLQSVHVTIVGRSAISVPVSFANGANVKTSFDRDFLVLCLKTGHKGFDQRSKSCSGG